MILQRLNSSKSTCYIYFKHFICMMNKLTLPLMCFYFSQKLLGGNSPIVGLYHVYTWYLWMIDVSFHFILFLSSLIIELVTNQWYGCTTLYKCPMKICFYFWIPFASFLFLFLTFSFLYIFFFFPLEFFRYLRNVNYRTSLHLSKAFCESIS